MENIMNAPEKIILEKKTIIVPFTSTSDDDLVGSVVTFFKIIPKKQGKDWVTKIVNTSDSAAKPTIAPPLLFSFQSADPTSHIQKDLELYQKVTLIADLPKNDEENPELWQFYDNGVVFINEPPTSELCVHTEIKNQGQRLIITIDNVANDLSKTALAFRYVASCIDTSKGAGKLKVYYSQDPSIKVRRRRQN
jgi:hypothetical protein